jgi:prepilin-type N-terminal cleavage/methylation domain-containing protein
MSRRRGFSLVEVMVGMLVLTIVIMTTISMFTTRQRRLRQANETILAYQALANEAEIWRRVDFKDLDPAASSSFRSDTAILQPLVGVTTVVKVATARADVKNVTLTVRWENGKQKAALSLVRVDTGGSGLW